MTCKENGNVITTKFKSNYLQSMILVVYVWVTVRHTGFLWTKDAI